MSSLIPASLNNQGVCSESLNEKLENSKQTEVKCLELLNTQVATNELEGSLDGPITFMDTLDFNSTEITIQSCGNVFSESELSDRQTTNELEDASDQPGTYMDTLGFNSKEITIRSGGNVISESELSDIQTINELADASDLPGTYMDTLGFNSKEITIRSCGNVISKSELSDRQTTNELDEDSDSNDGIPRFTFRESPLNILKRKTGMEKNAIVPSKRICLSKFKHLKSYDDPHEILLFRSLKKTFKKSNTFKKKLLKLQSKSYIEEHTITQAFFKFQERLVRCLTNRRRCLQKPEARFIRLYKRCYKCFILIIKRVGISFPETDNIIVDVGIPPIIAKLLRDSRRILRKHNKACTLSFDWMDIRPSVVYDSYEDRMRGYVDYGDRVVKEVADKALVFMLQGVYRKWKIPVAFYFTKGKPKELLSNLIKQVISRVFRCGYHVLATVCDMATVNVEALNLLMNSDGDANLCYFNVDSEKIQVLYDVPSLLINTRDCLMSSDFLLNEEPKIQWSHIELLYTILKSCLPRNRILTKKHMKPNNLSKKSVHLAAQTFSQKIGGLIGFSIEHNLKTDSGMELIPSSAIGTAHFFTFINSLFDSLNSSSFKDDREKRPVTKLTYGLHFQRLWENAISNFDKMQLFEKGTEVFKSRESFQDGWITTIKSFKEIWQIVKHNDKGFRYLATRNLSMDPLKNALTFIKKVKNYPTENEFICGLHWYLMKQNKYVDLGSNSRKEGFKLLTYLELIPDYYFDPSPENTDSRLSKIFPLENKIIQIFMRDIWSNRTTFLVSSYIAQQIVEANKECFCCRESLTSKSVVPVFLQFRNNCRFLRRPSEDLINAVKAGVRVIFKDQPKNILNQFFVETCLLENLKARIKNGVIFEWVICKLHYDAVVDGFTLLISRMYIKAWVERYNYVFEKSRLNSY